MKIEQKIRIASRSVPDVIDSNFVETYTSIFKRVPIIFEFGCGQSL